MTVFKIDNIPDFSKKDRIVVVGVIGKSPYRYPNKTTPLLPSVNSDENGIECHWDERRSVLYLHAVTYLDTKQLTKLAENLDENSKSTEKDADAAHWLVAAGELAADSCRTIALLFHLCHIVVLSHPTPVFDLGYLQLFKAIDAYSDNTKEHSSGVRYISACNCGRTKCSREDPYTVKRANYTFYIQAAEECGVCPSLLTVEFPVFQPSTPTYKEASVKGEGGRETQDKTPPGSQEDPAEPEPDADGDGDGEGEGEGEGPWSVVDALSPGSARDEDNSPASDGYVVPVRGESTQEKVITRQPSTTEYLPGMLHTTSPAGLLPAFPSWSLVCLGASSLYSHSAGLPEHLQPGFLPHTNYLLPWDCAVRMEQASLFRAPRGRGKPSGAHHLTVKIFIGFEYECSRGHRFMMSSPDTVVSGGACGPSAGARLASARMPLGAPCPCRAPHASTSPPQTPARLQRLHVVTPKAPVHVTLQPQVQPVPGGPIFVPLPSGSPPIKLSASAYWVLRFPRVYCDERGVLPRPRLNASPSAVGPAPLAATGTLIPPIFGLQD
ncbi:unnamed protein product [Chilo suppressalis]|uniref:Nonsense-mediated mRNA decay factor SMG8 n=1 Tax=Chilo suppressalis TaxID=168631 RepID=A0ABN8B0Y4_CHISP|nr:hypothetical protein evm_011059 [Chilo suppressalis]CAH0399037.1 unnamed protein product [Chilo suppressalis]